MVKCFGPSDISKLPVVTARNQDTVKAKVWAGLPSPPGSLLKTWTSSDLPGHLLLYPCHRETLKCHYFRTKDFISKMSTLNKSRSCVCVCVCVRVRVRQREREKTLDHVQWSFQTAILGMWEGGKGSESLMSQPLKEQWTVSVALQPTPSLPSWVQLWNAVTLHPYSVYVEQKMPKTNSPVLLGKE